MCKLGCSLVVHYFMGIPSVYAMFLGTMLGLLYCKRYHACICRGINQFLAVSPEDFVSYEPGIFWMWCFIEI